MSHRLFACALTATSVLASLALAACRSTTAPAQSAQGPDVWAVVDGREIKKDSVEKAYRRTVDNATSPSDEEVLGAKLTLLDDLITQDLLLAKAKAAGIVVSETDVEKAFADQKQNMPDEAFQKEIGQRGLTVADMKDGVRRELTIQRLFDQAINSTIAVTDQDVATYYNTHREQFHLTETAYRIGQIVVTPTPGQVTNRRNDDATTPEAALRKVQMIAEKLRSGTPFSELAADYSEDPQSAPQGGDLGFVPASRLQQVPAPLRDAVLKSQPGTISQVSVGGAYTIVLLIAKEPAGQRDLSTPGVKDTITSALRDRRSQLRRAAFVTNLRNGVTIVNYLAKQLAPVPPPPAPVLPQKK